MHRKFIRAVPFTILAACIAASFVFKRFVFVAWYPVVMSACFALAFRFSLMTERPLCLAFAEAMPPHIIPDDAAPYCRKLTQIWYIILATNTLIAYLTVSAPHWVWFAWNCCGAYLMMGLVFLVEGRIRRNRFALVFHTSGSTSKPKEIVKPFETLAKEVGYHRDALHDALSQKPLFLATIEPQHMYGTLWRRMLPAAANCEVDPEVIMTPEALLAKMKAAEKVFLVTTPSFLDRFTSYADQYDIPHNCVEITTSGALLTADVAARTERVFGIAPREIFGSTETGGVAWRRQSAAKSVEEFDWEVFAPVRVSVDAEGLLVVRSPFSFARVFTMGDGVELSPDGRRFKLFGRRDRVAKINEQRVSLPEMEARMAALDNVKEAALVKLEGTHGDFLGAVVVTKNEPPTGDAKRQAALALRRELVPIFPKGAVPKKYRFVREMPRNPQGKVLAAELRRIMESEND